MGCSCTSTRSSPGLQLLNIGLEVSNRSSKGLSFDPTFRVTMFNTLTKNSELRLDGSAGTRLGVAAEHYQRFGLSRFFVAPTISAERRITEYFVDGEAIAEYQVRRYIAAADAGVRLNEDTELRAGYIYGRVDLERGIGSEILPEFGGLERRTHILLRHDSQTSPFAPISGLLGGIEYRYWDHNPIREGGFGQLEGRGSLFYRVRRRDRVFVQFGGGTSFGAGAPVPYKFTLGGLYRLSGYENDEFRGDHYLLAGAGYMYGLGRLPDLIGGPIYATLVFDAGSAFDTWDAAQGRTSLGVGLALDTLVGPVSAQIAFNKDGGSRFFFLMGRTVPTR